MEKPHASGVYVLAESSLVHLLLVQHTFLTRNTHFSLSADKCFVQPQVLSSASHTFKFLPPFRLKTKTKTKNLWDVFRVEDIGGGRGDHAWVGSSPFWGRPLVSAVEGLGHSPSRSSSSRRRKIHQLLSKPANHVQEEEPGVKESRGFCGPTG